MNIRKYYKIKVKLEDKIQTYTDEVNSRWQQLVGFGCGYFYDWGLGEKEGIVHVTYDAPRGGGKDVDEIPMKFFEIENDDEAVEQFRVFVKQREKESILKQNARIREIKWEEYKKLKKEFEPNV
jgi:hypothetical protein